MPFKSKAQQKYFHYLESQGKMPKKTVDEFDKATDFEKLPEKVKAYSYGGEVESPDEEQGEAHDYASSGEPHENEGFQSAEDMENESGCPQCGYGAPKMSHGGFAKALRKSIS
jgi:hypothetical protein